MKCTHLPYLCLVFILFLAAIREGAEAQVVISELVTNNTKYEDEDTDEPDWFELHNTGDTAVNLEGWSLTTSESGEGAWTIQHLSLEANSVRLFFASSKDRPGAAATAETYRPHTSFNLTNAGGYLALLKPDGTVAHSIQYPELGKNVAYGVKSADEGFFFPATPNAANPGSASPKALAPRVEFSHQGGLLTNTIELTLEVPDHPEAEIQYAFDGAEPSIFTPSYKGPITIDKSTTVTARVLLPDHLPSRLTTVGFAILEESLTDFAETGAVFESNLPVLVIESLGENIDATRTFKPAFVSVTRPDEESGRTVLGAPAEYAGPCAVHLRGESSAGFGQKSYSLEIQDEDGEDQDRSLLGMPAESDWVLYGPWSEKTLMRNKLVFDWMRTLRGDDGTSVRTAFCELFLSQRGDEAVGYNSYQGVYLLMEKIKRGRDRVPIQNINEETVDPDMITGGYIIRRDKVDGGKSSWTTSTYNQPLQSFDPDRFNTEQLDYVRGYINSFETALKGDQFASPTRGYQKYIEPDTFIDAQWFVEIAKQVDGYVFSTYWHKDRDGKLRAGPLWDFNISLGNADYATGDNRKGWLYNNAGGRGQIWFPRLHADPEYHLAHWDRYWEMRQGIFSDDAIDAVIDGHMATLLDGYSEPVGNRAPDSIQNPVARQFRKYPFLGNRQWPNPPAETSIKTWQEEVEYMRDWFKDRMDWLDDQSLPFDSQVFRAPRFSHPTGNLAGAIDLEIIPHKGGLFDGHKYPTETIYYTTDGSDPRITGGDLSDTAQIYSGPIQIESTTTIQARILHKDHWSPKVSGTFLLDAAPASAENLVISEIMYHPTDPNGLESFSGFNDSNHFEFLELTNVGSTLIDLTGVRFSRGLQFEFISLPANERLIEPGTSILLVKNLAGFKKRHPDVDPSLVRGQYFGKLDNAGERVSMENADGEEIADIRYNDSDSWPAEADGGGFSLVWVGNADSDPKEPTSWQASSKENGNPGTHSVIIGSGPDLAIDTDQDGLSDALEDLLGSSPTDPESAYLPQVRHEAGTEPATFTLLQRHRSDLGDTTLEVEQSRDLTAWEPLATEAPQIAESHADGTVTSAWSLLRANDGQPTFVRIRLSSE